MSLFVVFLFFMFYFRSYPFALFRSRFYFLLLLHCLPSSYTHTHMYMLHYAFPIHLIKIRQNEKCDKSIYFVVILDIALLRFDALRCSRCYKSYVMPGQNAKKASIYVHMDMCLLCEACHYTLYFI